MTATVTQLGRSLGLGWSCGEPARKPSVAQPFVPGSKVTARLSLLPNQQRRWKAVGAGFFFQCFGVVLLITLPMLFPEKLLPRKVYQYVSLTAPPTMVPMPPPQPRARMKVPPPKPEIVEPPHIAKLIAPPRPKLQPKEIKPRGAPKIEPVFMAAKIDIPKNEPARPRPPIETGVLSTGSAAPATVNQPIHKVQTGGFGDPEGLPGKGDPNKRANIARFGSPDLPVGPGYGNGTGGATGVRGTVVSAGFGNGVAVPPSGGQGNGRGAIRQSGFSDAKVTAEAPRPRATTATPDTQPVEILYKPNPVYTEEARRRRLEGEVLVEVVFLASGEVRVARVVRGLGHGLDEAALRAAQQIRFKSARRGGQAVDFPATVHIVFQMAY